MANYKDVAMDCLRIIEGGQVSGDSNFEMLDLEDAIRQAAAFIIKRDFWKDTNATGETEINYTYLEIFEDLPVLYNSVRDCYYVELPVDVISLPQDYGVQYVSERQNLTDPYTRTQIGTIGFYTNLPDDITSWFMSSKNIQLVNFDSTIKTLTLGLIPALPTTIGDDDVFEIKEIVCKKYMQVPQEDKISDNNANNR